MNYGYDANGRMTSAVRTDNTGLQTSVYDCAGQRVQTTAGNLTRTMVYDIFGQDVADYANGSLERENIYRGGQLLATSETLNAAAPATLTTTPSTTSIALSWSAASGATNYRVERKGAGGSYSLVGTTTSTSTTDNGVSSGSAYLYRVCAADGAGNCASDYSNIALGMVVSFTDATIVSYSDNPTNATTIKAAHITELRTAINAVRSLAGQPAATWTHPSLASGDLIYADDVRDLRSGLNAALVVLSIQTSAYTDNTIVSYADDPLNATTVKAVHIRELRQRATSGSGASGSGGSSGGLKYVLSDLQGSARAVMNNNGVGTSTVIARHDYLTFGEEIWSATGMRSSSQGYGTTDRNRQKYGLTERDDATGLDHTWWRKYESFSGRWTTPDPYRGSMYIANPQSFNRYTYVQNDPANFVDPSGLDFCLGSFSGEIRIPSDVWPNLPWVECDSTKTGGSFGGGGADGRGGGPGGGLNQKPKKNSTPLKPQQQNREKACEAKKQLKKCEKEARGKYAFTPVGPGLDSEPLFAGEDLGLSAAGGGVTTLLRVLGGAKLAAAIGSGGESLVISLLLSSGWRNYKLGRAKGAAMQKAYDEEQNTIAKCHADFENTVREAGYDPQQVLTKQEWNDCH